MGVENLNKRKVKGVGNAMRNREIKINMNKRRINAIEDAFFVTLNTKQYEKIKPTLLLIWREICRSYGK